LHAGDRDFMPAGTLIPRVR